MRMIDRFRFAGRARSGLAMLVFAVAILCATPAVLAAAPLTGTFQGKGTGRNVVFQYQGKSQNDWTGTLKLKLDNGPSLSVFCVQITVRVRSGDRYRSDGPVLALPNGCKIRYLLDKYPASTAKSADEAAARQMAIWVFSDGVDPATIQDAAIRDRAIALVNEAKQGACPQRRTEAPDLTLDPSAASPSAGQTVAYTIRASAADAGHTAKVSVSGPAALSDAGGASSGQQQQDVTLDAQGQANFWVVGTGPGQTTVRVELPYRLEAGTVFSHLDPGAPTQRLVLAESRNLTASASGQLSWSGPVGQPTATAPAEAPQPPSPTALAATPEAAAPSPTPAPPKPTHRPSHRSDTSTPAEQPTAAVASGEQATAIPTPASAEVTAVATAEAAAAGQATPAAAAAPGAPAGGAAQPRPRSLPNTAAPDAGAGDLVGVSLGLLALGGWLLWRRKTLDRGER